MSIWKVIWYSMSSEGPQLEQVIPTHWNSCRNSQLSTQRIPVPTPPSHAVSSYPHSNLHEFHYSPNTCTLPQNVAQNLCATWCSTFRIVEAQCPSITEITLKSPFLCVVWFSGLHKSYSCTQYIQWEQQTIKGVHLIINLYNNNNNDSRYNNNKNNDTNNSYWPWL